MATLDITSRYQLDAGGQTASRKPTSSVVYYLHRVVEGDTILNIASRALGSDRRWWEIADLNPHIKYPEDLVVGGVIRVPQ